MTDTFSISISGDSNDSNLVLGSTSGSITEGSGPTGPVGPVGPVGPTGPAGPAGPTGALDISLVTDISSAIAQLVSSLTSNNADDLLQQIGIDFNTTGIASNAADVSTNAAGVTSNLNRLDIHEALVTKNVQDITKNVQDITKNVQDITALQNKQLQHGKQLLDINISLRQTRKNNRINETNYDLLALDIDDLDVYLAPHGFDNSINFTLPFLLVSGDTISDDISNLNVFNAYFDSNYNLDLSTSLIKSDMSLGIPFFSKSDHTDYLNFTALNCYEDVTSDFIFEISGTTYKINSLIDSSAVQGTDDVSNLSVTDLSFYNMLLSNYNKKWVTGRSPLASETLLGPPNTPKPNENLLVNSKLNSSTSFTVEQIKKNFTPNTFNKIINETEVIDNENITNTCYYIDNTETTPNNYDFIFDASKFNNVQLANGEEIGWMHYLFGLIFLNKVNVLNKIPSDGYVMAGYSNHDKAYSLSDPNNIAKLNSVKYLWDDNNDIIHVNANVYLKSGQTPLQAFNDLLGNSNCYSLEYFKSNFSSNSTTYNDLSASLTDSWKYFNMNLLKSSPENQKNSFTTNTKWLVKNTVNGYLPDISGTATVLENAFELEQNIPDQRIKYKLSNAGFKYLLDNANNLSPKEVYDVLNNSSYVNITTTDESLVEFNNDMFLQSYSGTLGSTTYAQKYSNPLNININNKKALLDTELKDLLISSYKLNGYMNLNNYQKNKTGYFVFSDTPISQVSELMNSDKLSMINSNNLYINNYDSNKIITRVNRHEYNFMMDTNARATSDYVKLALLVYDNNNTFNKLKTNLFASDNDFFMDTSGAREWLTNVNDSLKVDLSGSGILDTFYTDFETEINSISVEFSNNTMVLNRLGASNYKLKLQDVLNNTPNFISYGVQNKEGKFTLGNHLDYKHPDITKKESDYKSNLAEALSVITGDTSLNELAKIETYITNKKNSYINVQYANIVTNALQALDSDISNVSGYPVGQSVDDKLNWLNANNDLSNVLQIYEDKLDIALLSELSLNAVPTPDSSSCVVFENHTRTSNATYSGLAKSLNATQILKTKCGYTNCKLLCVGGNGSTTDIIISSANMLNSNYINDPSKNPLIVASRFNGYADPTYIADTTSYFNKLEGNFLNDVPLHQSGYFNFVVKDTLLSSQTPNKVIEEKEIVKTTYNNSVGFFSYPTFVTFIYGTYSDGGASGQVKLKRNLSYYMFPPLSTTSDDAISQLTTLLSNGSTPLERLNNLYQKILNSTIESSATVYSNMNGITDINEIQKANSLALDAVSPNTELHRLLSLFITNHGSLKKLNAPELLKYMNEIAYGNGITGFENDKYNAISHLVLTDPSNIALVDEISNINNLSTTLTVNNGSDIAIFNKSQFSKYVPANKMGNLLFKNEQEYSAYDKLLVIDPSL